MKTINPGNLAANVALDVGATEQPVIVRLTTDTTDGTKTVDVYLSISHGSAKTVVLVDIDTARGDIDVDMYGETIAVIREGQSQEWN